VPAPVEQVEIVLPPALVEPPIPAPVLPPVAPAADPWAPPVTSIPGMAVSAPPAPPAPIAEAPAPPAPVAEAPPAPAPIAEAPPAPAPIAEAPPAPAPIAEAPPAPAPVQAPAAPVAVAPLTVAPPAPPVPVAAPVVDAADLLDFDDTVIAGRRQQGWVLTPTGGTPIRIESTSALIGRNPAARASAADAQLVPVPDPSKTVSKTHALITLSEGVWSIIDLASTNGVYLVDAAGEELELQPSVATPIGDTFKLGEQTFRMLPEA